LILFKQRPNRLLEHGNATDVERGVGHHEHEELSRHGVDPAKHETRHGSLLDAWPSLIRIV